MKDPEFSRVEATLGILVCRHESLRTYFAMSDGIVKQCVVPYDKRLFAPQYYDIRGRDPESAIAEILDSPAGDLFTVDTPPLMRTLIFRVSESLASIHLIVHHIVFDLWSKKILLNELTEIYRSLGRGLPVSADPHPIQLRDYAIWQKDWLRHNTKAAILFWRSKLQQPMSQPVPGGVDATLSVLNTVKADRYLQFFDEPAFKALRSLSARAGTGVATVLYASLAILFYLLEPESRPLLAMPVACRHYPWSRSIVGYLMGGLYLYPSIEKELPLIEFIRTLFAEFLQSAGYLIYDHAIYELNEPNLRCNCTIFVNYSDANAGQRLEPKDAEGYYPVNEPAYYALAWETFEYENGLQCSWKYNPARLDATRIGTIVSLHKTLVRQICDQPEISLSELQRAITPTVAV